MVQFFSQTFRYDHPWQQVTIAIFQKYPNPFASHVLTSDVIERYIDPETGILHTTRLFLKKGTIPKWGLTILGKSEAFILETSTVDPKTKTMTTVTRNLSLTKIMLVEDTQIIHPSPTGHGTNIITKARIVSNTGWDGIRSRIESFGIRKFKDNTARSAKGLGHVLERIKDRFQSSP